MPIIDYFIKGLQNYVNFNGRASRSEFWWFVLASFILGLLAGIIDLIGGLKSPDASVGTVGLLVILAMFLPTLSLSIRRFHDSGTSGWMYLVNMIPFIGFFIYLYFMIKSGDDFDNEYGPVT